MSIQRLPIFEFLQRKEKNLLLDVRSPSEYHHAQIPGAISFPLFSDEERRIVGTAYKQQSREQAIKIGLDFFGPKMRKMVEEVEGLIPPKSLNEKLLPLQVRNTEIFIYCWRGGMRSAAIAWLLDLYGFRVYTLSGGYKSFRNWVLQSFERPYSFKILGGYTGSGKTELLAQLEKKGEKVIDLEKLASHKGSAFGSFKMPPQPSQEMFENLLALELEDNYSDPSSLIWLEDESQRIGNLNLPGALWETMRKAPVVFLEIPFEERLEHLVEEYGAYNREKLIECVLRIKQRLGGLEAKNTVAFLEEGNCREAFRILLHYYDKRYLKGLQSRDGLTMQISRVFCDRVVPDNVQRLNYQTV